MGQSWTGGLAQGCAPVFQPFGEPGETSIDVYPLPTVIIISLAGKNVMIIITSFYRTQVSLGSDLWVRLSLTNKQTEEPFADLTYLMKILTQY